MSSRGNHLPRECRTLSCIASTDSPGSSSGGCSTARPQDQLQKRLRRIEGQVRGLLGMVDDHRWCPEILQQIAAVQAARNKVVLGLAEGHVQNRMSAGTDDPQRRDEMTRELMQALGRLAPPEQAAGRRELR